MTTSALVLVGHGSTRHPDGAAPVLALADDIRRSGRFAQVAAVFMKQSPKLAEAEAMVNAATVFVVPVFAGKGYYTDTLIPREMGLVGPITERGGRRFIYTAPAGTHPRIPGVLACRAEGVATGAGMVVAETTLLLIAHGSSRPGGAGETPRAIAAAMAAMNRFAEIVLVFLEQEPKAETWASLATCRDVVALPLLVAQGMHASQDIPPLFGLENGNRGPVQSQGHRVVLGTGLGAEPELVDIILEMAAAASA
ncbi:CbiX/SirB N-terminal domain-containing protein [Paramagnetospirillum kuznetsovii]|nr:CbiX/SirB N-terminal domain-containing protein [Paramagnetospirillum kuznetsovii]